eukprot:754898-Hanusia_phi.AAC.10
MAARGRTLGPCRLLLLSSSAMSSAALHVTAHPPSPRRMRTCCDLIRLRLEAMESTRQEGSGILHTFARIFLSLSLKPARLVMSFSPWLALRTRLEPLGEFRKIGQDLRAPLLLCGRQPVKQMISEPAGSR